MFIYQNSMLMRCVVNEAINESTTGKEIKKTGSY